jgi:hypothetical protein
MLKLPAHSRYAYSPIVERKDYSWPGGKRPPIKLRRLKRLGATHEVSNGRVMTPSNSRDRAFPPQHCG